MKLKKRIYNSMDNLRIPMIYTPLWTLLHLGLVLVTSMMLLFQVLATSLFVNRTLQVIAGKNNWSFIVLPAIFLCIIVAWDKLNKPLNKAVQCKLENVLRANFRSDITRKRASLEYTHIENPKTWDLIQRVTKDSENTVIKGLISVEGLVGIIVQSVGILSLVFMNGWWIAVLCIVVSIPMLVFAMKGGKAQYEEERKVANLERRYDYLSGVLLGRETTDERELFGIINQLSNKWLAYYNKVRKHRLVVEFKWYARQKISAIVISMMTVVIALALMDKVVSGALSKGLYIALIQGVAQLVTKMVNVSTHMNGLAKSTEYYKDLTAFVELSETKDALAIPSKKIPEFKSLEFKNVTFRYPGTKKDILKNLSFRLEAGKHYAVVGENGAGKTTLTKLITGLYSNYEGEIFINGNNIRDYKQADLKAFVSVLFQDFAKYSVSLRDNIAIGDASSIFDEKMDDRVLKVLKDFRLTEMVNKLEAGIYTPLGKIHHKGQDLSGGQWQKVAMARTMIANSPLNILDEPTAALDPISESEIYSEFDKICKTVTTIFISHRLGSTKLADEILVIHNGGIYEKGTHNELIQLSGKYAKMYESQRSWYQ